MWSVLPAAGLWSCRRFRGHRMRPLGSAAALLRRHREYELVPAPGDGLDVARTRGAVVQGDAQLPHAGTDALLELHHHVAAPQVVPDLLPGDRVVRVAQQQFQELRHLGTQLHRLLTIVEFTAIRAEAVLPERVMHSGWFRRGIHAACRCPGDVRIAVHRAMDRVARACGQCRPWPTIISGLRRVGQSVQWSRIQGCLPDLGEFPEGGSGWKTGDRPVAMPVTRRPPVPTLIPSGICRTPRTASG